jgi:hypothetical protein
LGEPVTAQLLAAGALILTPWAIDLFGCPVMVRQPHWAKRVSPVVVSISRQISFERSANGEYSTPSPTATRVNLVSPVDEPNHAAVYSGRSQEPLFLTAPSAMLRRCPPHPDRQRSLRIMAWLASWVLRRSLETVAAEAVACLQRSTILSTPTTTTPGHLR